MAGHMGNLVFVDELSARDLGDVVRLERICHPRDVREGRERLRSLLKYVDRTGWGLNLGLFSGGKLIGYVLSHEDDASSLNPGSREYVVYVDDLAVHPQYRRYVSRLLARYLRKLRGLYPNHGLEANGFESIIKIWIRHRAFFLTNGYRLSETRATGETRIGRPVHVIRWEPVPRDVTPARDAGRRHSRLSSTYALDGSEYKVEVWKDEDEWHHLARHWNALLLKTPEATVFQTYEYQRVWWRHFGLSRELFILVIQHKQEVIGIAPLQTTPTRYYGKYFRELGFIGTNWEVDRPKFLFADHAAICSDLTARFLGENDRYWDLCRLYEQREDSFVLTTFQEQMRRYGYLTGTTKDATAPYLSTAASWDTFRSSLSRRLRKNLAAAKRKLATHGRVSYADFSTYPEVVDKLQWYRDIEQRSWKAAAAVGPSKSGPYYRFYADLAEAFGKTGQFHLRFITLDETPVAGTFGLQFNGTFYSLHIAHDREYAKYSLGTLLESMELESCFSGDCREYDFLGSFLNNKLRWTSTVRNSRELHVYQRQWRLVLLYVLYLKLKPVVKDAVKAVLKDKVQILVRWKEKAVRISNRRRRQP
jgi:CelD/BcsL family acetyltransferase involved in cellulose biosynthesis